MRNTFMKTLRDTRTLWLRTSTGQIRKSGKCCGWERPTTWSTPWNRFEIRLPSQRSITSSWLLSLERDEAPHLEPNRLNVKWTSHHEWWPQAPLGPNHRIRREVWAHCLTTLMIRYIAHSQWRQRSTTTPSKCHPSSMVRVKWAVKWSRVNLSACLSIQE